LRCTVLYCTGCTVLCFKRRVPSGWSLGYCSGRLVVALCVWCVCVVVASFATARRAQFSRKRAKFRASFPSCRARAAATARAVGFEVKRASKKRAHLAPTQLAPCAFRALKKKKTRATRADTARAVCFAPPRAVGSAPAQLAPCAHRSAGSMKTPDLRVCAISARRLLTQRSNSRAAAPSGSAASSAARRACERSFCCFRA